MNSQIVVDGKPLKLNRFISELTASVLDAVARSLKCTSGNKIQFRLRGEEIAMFVDEQEVSLTFGSASRIVRDVLNGLVKNLYGSENANEIILMCERISDQPETVTDTTIEQ